jgi:hypothetical protein
MKRKILLWLASLRHKPRWLHRKIEMLYWSNLLDIHEKKEKRLSEHDKKIQDLSDKLIQRLNDFKTSLLHSVSETDIKLKKLKENEAMNKMIMIMRQERSKPTDEEIYDRLRHLGFHPPEALKPEVREKIWQDLATKKQYTVDHESKKKIDTKKMIPVSEDSLKIIKKEAKKKITKLTRSKPNGKSKTTK